MDKKKLAQIQLLASLAAIGTTRNPHKDIDDCPSIKVKTETCPNCGETHKNRNKLCCSPECYKELRAKQKQ